LSPHFQLVLEARILRKELIFKLSTATQTTSVENSYNLGVISF